MRKLISYLAPYKKSVMIAVAFMLLDVVCEVVQPTLMSDIVGRGIQTGNIPFILGVGALMILYLRLVIAFIPTQLYKILPYVVTVIVLIISSMRNNKEKQPPASLGLNYFREER